MKKAQIKEMVRGWFVGGFEPAAFNTQACEVGVKHYKVGDEEAAHYHKIATEVTLVLTGSVSMRGHIWNAGDIVVLEPGDITAFKALTDATTVVVKVPGVLNDRYLV
ncbi:cupin domain-containing protein [Pseudomonas syringae]|nr:hypothetical protein [Pseudomonas syringae]